MVATPKKSTATSKTSGGQFNLQQFDPAELTATPITGWAAYTNPSTKQGSVRLILGAKSQDLPILADTSVAAIVTILESGNCFFDGTNVITRHL